MRNLTSKWRRPEMKNSTARITMMKRTAGLILVPEDDEDDDDDDDDDGVGSL